MEKDGKKMEATETPQIKLAREIVEIKYRADLPLDVGFVAQVPFIIG